MNILNPNQTISSDDLNANFSGLADGTEIQDNAILARHIEVGVWHIVGEAGEPAYENSWVAYDSDTQYGGAEFMKDAYGFVHLRGLVKSGVINADVFTLPEAYRPAYRHLFPVQQGSNTMQRLDVDDSGYVRLVAGTNNYLSLNGIKFQAGG